MTTLAKRLCRNELLELTPYQSARRIGGSGEIWLNANESPFCNFESSTVLNGESSTVLEGESSASINRYPEAQPNQLRSHYANYVKLSDEQVLVTRGADEGIELLIRAFCTPGIDSICYAVPTYGMYQITAQTYHVACVEVALDDSFDLPMQLAEQAKRSKLVFVCNPNNPTGNLVSIDKLQQLCRDLPNQIVVVDEAYIEFSPQHSMVPFLSQLPNLVVLRTLSKAFALAGARVGYVLASSDIIDILNRVIAPYPIPLPSSELAEQAVSPQGLALMESQVEQLNLLKQSFVTFANTLAQVTRVYPSGANFVQVRFDDPNYVQQQLAKQGIVVRAYSHPRLTSCLRFSIGNQSQMNRLQTALSDICAQKG
ncbi:histidinol-phosphate transaminase [Paraferrimonas haliotis]|uniref:Histidinol-phosphate aminotransferase n=1 Tax=Paraferrimonas haliotis TaxID=2013866 RepID=A0AA37WXX0_9GAMM|nr:histidinol-phosphate transaminase [Paraferrimonas haliotis]GLS84752.1 histidinol-phosphate aminotransferase [Paraferrimonas haliotis]